MAGSMTWNTPVGSRSYRPHGQHAKLSSAIPETLAVQDGNGLCVTSLSCHEREVHTWLRHYVVVLVLVAARHAFARESVGIRQECTSCSPVQTFTGKLQEGRGVGYGRRLGNCTEGFLQYADGVMRAYSGIRILPENGPDEFRQKKGMLLYLTSFERIISAHPPS